MRKHTISWTGDDLPMAEVRGRLAFALETAPKGDAEATVKLLWLVLTGRQLEDGAWRSSLASRYVPSGDELIFKAHIPLHGDDNAATAMAAKTLAKQLGVECQTEKFDQVCSPTLFLSEISQRLKPVLATDAESDARRAAVAQLLEVERTPATERQRRAPRSRRVRDNDGHGNGHMNR